MNKIQNMHFTIHEFQIPAKLKANTQEREVSKDDDRLTL